MTSTMVSDSRAALARALCPLSSCQQRVWRLSHAQPEISFFERIDVRFQGPLRVDLLDRALAAIVQRHGILRSVFVVAADRPMQLTRPSGGSGLAVVDLQALPAARRERAAVRLARRRAQPRFDVRRGPLMTAIVLRMAFADHVLLLRLHHLVFDGWSHAVLHRELGTLVMAFGAGRAAGRGAGPWDGRGDGPGAGPGRGPGRGPGPGPGPGPGAGPPLPLPPLRLQYADLARREQAPAAVARREAQLATRVERLRGLGEPATLPCDRPRPAHTSHRGATMAFALSPDAWRAVRQVSESEGLTVFMVMLAALAIVLRGHSAEGAGASASASLADVPSAADIADAASVPVVDVSHGSHFAQAAPVSDAWDIALGVPVANRTSTEAEALIGPFVNILLVRLPVVAGMRVRELLARTRAVMLDAFAHQEVPFDRLLEALHPGAALGSYGPLGGPPLFRICVDFTATEVDVAGTATETSGEGRQAVRSRGGDARAGLRIAPFDADDAIAGCDLFLSMSMRHGTLGGLALYSAELFDAATVRVFLERLQAVLSALPRSLPRQLSEISW